MTPASGGLAPQPSSAGGCPALGGGSKCRALFIRLSYVVIRDSIAMLHWLYVAVHLLVEAFAARRDARIRFLRTEVEILRRKLGGTVSSQPR